MRAGICILLLMGPAQALNTDSLNLEITLDATGGAKVVERYALGFEHGFERNEFLRDEAQYSGSLLLWGSDPDYNFFFPHFVSGNKYETPSSVAFIEQTNTLLLEYRTQDLVQEAGGSGRSTVWQIDNRAFGVFFDETGSIKIPPEVRITITLPPNSEIDADNIPAGVEAAGNQLVFRGISTAFDVIEYRVLTPIAPRVSAVDLLTSPDTVLALAVILIVSGLAYFKRKDISSRIEEYIISNSRIEVEEEDEEMNLNI